MHAACCAEMVLRTHGSQQSRPRWWQGRQCVPCFGCTLVLCSQFLFEDLIKAPFFAFFVKYIRANWINSLLKFSNRKSKYLLRE